MDLTSILSLSANNPYSTGRVLRLEDNTVLLERPRLKYIPSNRDRYYTVIQGDTLDSIAYSAYGDSKLYFIIKDANDILFNYDLEVGDTLIIPDVDTMLNNQANSL